MTTLDTDRFKLIPAVYLILRKNEEILFSRRANTGYQDGKLGIVAGHVDGGEVLTQAMIREADEEAGIKIQPEDLKLVHTAHRLNDGLETERIDMFFECSKWQGEPTNMEPEKCDELRWVNVHSLDPDTLPLVARIINLVEQGVAYSEYESEPADF